VVACGGELCLGTVRNRDHPGLVLHDRVRRRRRGPGYPVGGAIAWDPAESDVSIVVDAYMFDGIATDYNKTDAQ
jgi:hypothetical protein